MGYFLVLLKTVVGSGQRILNKNYVRETAGNRSAPYIYMMLVHPIAAIFFFLLAGGSVPLNMPTFWFVLAYGTVCGLSAFTNLLAYAKTTLVYQAVFSGAGTLLIPFMFELFYDNSFSVGEYLSVALRIAAIAVPLFFNREKFRGVFICLALFFIGGVSTVVVKLFSQSSAVTSENSFCFWTNVVILPAVILLVVRQGGFGNLKADMGKLKPRHYLYIVGQTLTNNIMALLGIYVMRLISATMVSLLSSSISTLLTVLISVFLYKEELSKEGLISVLLSILSVVASVF